MYNWNGQSINFYDHGMDDSPLENNIIPNTSHIIVEPAKISGLITFASNEFQSFDYISAKRDY